MSTENIEELIAAEHARRGVNPTMELPKPEAAAPYDGMRFLIEVNEAAEGESVTVHVVHGTWSRRENKRKLRLYLDALGYTNKTEQKRILKGLGFWSKKSLGTQP